MLGDELLGFAKCVAPQELPLKRFRASVGLLEALVSVPAQALSILLLKEQVETLQGTVDGLRRTRRSEGQSQDGLPGRAAVGRSSAHPLQEKDLTCRVLAYLGDHYVDSRLSLSQVAEAMGRNQKYISHTFRKRIGLRMREFIIMLRVIHACDLLLHSNRPIAGIARDSGFTHPVQFRNSFRSAVGVSASEYRQIFTTQV